jgi:hypothetical protein
MMPFVFVLTRRSQYSTNGGDSGCRGVAREDDDDDDALCLVAARKHAKRKELRD